MHIYSCVEEVEKQFSDKGLFDGEFYLVSKYRIGILKMVFFDFSNILPTRK